MNVKIEKIEIRIGDQVINLTVEQAKELKMILADFFQERITYLQPYPVIIERPWVHWYQTYDGTTAGLSLIE